MDRVGLAEIESEINAEAAAGKLSVGPRTVTLVVRCVPAPAAGANRRE